MALILAWLLCSSASAQQVGGEFESFGTTEEGPWFQEESGPGDVDGDGVDDLIEDDWSSFWIRSGATGRTLITREQEYVGSELWSYSFKSWVGDVDQNGTDEVMYLWIRGINGLGYYYVRVDGKPSYQFQLGPSSSQAIRGSSAGDVDGDGLPDFAVGEGRSIDLYRGLTGQHLRTLTLPGVNNGVIALAPAGDADSDGIDDLLVASAYKVLVLSGATGAALHEFTHSYAALCLGGDLDRDGIRDWLIRDDYGGYCYSSRSGNLIFAWAFHSTVSSRDIANAGDVNQDGIDDVLISGDASPHQQYDLMAFLFDGRTGGLLFESEWTWGKTTIGALGRPNSAPRPVFFMGPEAFIFRPGLSSSASEVSNAAGGLVDFQLDFPHDQRLRTYSILASKSGTGPTDWFGVTVPLTIDAWCRNSLLHGIPNLSGQYGTLSAAGDASAQLTIPAGSAAALVGATVHFASVVHFSNRYLAMSSVAVELRIVP